jgi:hypothetical protein
MIRTDPHRDAMRMTHPLGTAFDCSLANIIKVVQEFYLRFFLIALQLGKQVRASIKAWHSL